MLSTMLFIALGVFTGLVPVTVGLAIFKVIDLVESKVKAHRALNTN